MDHSLSFKVCRVCVAFDSVGEFSSLFAANSQNAEKFQNVSGIDVSFVICFVITSTIVFHRFGPTLANMKL
jgi:hypothetical protein